MYEVPEGEPTDRIMALAQAARQRAQYRVAPWVRASMGMEAEAVEIKYYQIELIRGLLQTEAYARAVVTAYEPIWSVAEVNRLVSLRRQRQALLTGEDPPALTAVIHEASIRNLVGGPDVMREQLAHLLRAGGQPNVTLRLLPFTTGAHAPETDQSGSTVKPIIRKSLSRPNTASARVSVATAAPTETAYESVRAAKRCMTSTACVRRLGSLSRITRLPASTAPATIW
jgi:hypothetical protein